MCKLKKFNEHLENESLKEIIEDYFIDFIDSGILEIREAENASFSLFFTFSEKKEVKNNSDKLEFFISLGDIFKSIKQSIDKLSVDYKISYSMDDYISTKGAFEINIYGLKIQSGGFEKVSKTTWDEIYNRGRNEIDSKTVLFIWDKLEEYKKLTNKSKLYNIDVIGWSDGSKVFDTHDSYRQYDEKIHKPKLVNYDVNGTINFDSYWHFHCGLYNFDNSFGVKVQKYNGNQYYGYDFYLINKDDKSISDALDYIVKKDKEGGYTFR
jgi:hypothetical protein